MTIDSGLLKIIDVTLVEQGLAVKECNWSDKTQRILLAAYRLGYYDGAKKIDDAVSEAINTPDNIEDKNVVAVSQELSFLA